ncbi:MAG: hypothetical protein ABI306_08585 [Caulobacteraceae bacterium]
MENRPAEIDLGLDDLPVANGQDLGVAEALPSGVPTFVGDEDSVPVRDDIDEVEAGDRRAAPPAAGEIGRPVDAVVELVKWKSSAIRALIAGLSLST